MPGPAMDKLTKKTVDVSRGFIYTYYAGRATRNQPTLLMLHGFPDSPDSYADVINDYLRPNGYGVIVPVCLGYVGTSRPTEPEAYNFQKISGDLKEILENEDQGKVIVLGHDWGAAIAQRFYNFYPDRCLGLVMMNTAYKEPQKDGYNVEDMLTRIHAFLGYNAWAYWRFFTAPDAAQLMSDNAESMWDMVHGEPDTWLETLCNTAGARRFVSQGHRQLTMSYATEERRQKWIAEFRRGGFDAPLNYYRSMLLGVQDGADAVVPDKHYKIEAPFLFWGGQRDFVCRPELLQTSIDNGLVPDCRIVVVDDGHWSHLSLPNRFGETVIGWLEEKFCPEDRKP